MSQVKEFNSIVRELLSIFENKSRTEIERANVDRLRKRINLFKSTVGEEAVLEKAGSYLYEFSNEIIDRKEAFFLGDSEDSPDFTSYMKGESRQDVELAMEMIENIRGYYRKMRRPEQDAVYAKVKRLHDLYLEYQISQ